MTDPKRGYTTGMAVYETYDASVPTVEKPFGLALVEAARRRPEIGGLTADLAKYTDLDTFAREFPGRYFQVGMAEQNLIGVAAGLARTGFVPFATSYCTFVTRRAYDFISIAVAEGRANVKIIAALPGITTGYGATHQGLEDLALMRAVPGLVVIDPCDATEIQQAVQALADYSGPAYLRILRGRVKRVFDPASHRFELGKARWVRRGGDVLLISTGLMTDRALQAAEMLAAEKIEAANLHVPTVKPLDEEAILAAARATPVVVTLENHSIVNGLGTAVCELLAQAGVAARLRKIGIPDRFIECGSVAYLTEKYGLSVRCIVEAARQAAGEGARPRPKRRSKRGQK